MGDAITQGRIDYLQVSGILFFLISLWQLAHQTAFSATIHSNHSSGISLVMKSKRSPAAFYGTLCSAQLFRHISDRDRWWIQDKWLQWVEI